jgi:hypothetical protein
MPGERIHPCDALGNLLVEQLARGRRELPVRPPLGPGQGADHVGKRAEAEHEESAEK